MKIVLITDYFQPKIGYAETFIAKELQNLGHEIIVLTSNLFYPFPDYHNTVYNVLGDREQPIGSRIEEGILTKRIKCKFEIFNRAFLVNLKEEVIAYKPDRILVFGISSVTLIAILQMSSFLNIPIVAGDSHHMSILSKGFFYKKWFYNIFKFIFANKISKNIKNCFGEAQDTLEIINKVYGISKNKIHHISWGTDMDSFYRDYKMREELRHYYSISKDQIVFIYTGKLIAEKGPHLIVSAAEILSTQYNNFVLLFIGNGDNSYINLMKNIAKQNNFIERLLFLPLVKYSELYKYYSMADVGIWPLQESTSMLDALACGLPIIIDGKSGVVDRISNNNGFVYLGGADGLADKMKHFLDNNENIGQMGANSVSLVKREYTWTATTRKILDLYK